MTLAHWLTLAALFTGAATIVADWRVRRPAFYILKPLTTLWLIALLLAAPGPQPRDYQTLLLAGFALCLVGDVALMFQGTRAFVAGLSAFLLGHLAFGWAFFTTLPLSGKPGVGSVVVVAVALPYAVFVMRRAGRLAPAVAAYFAAILGMTVLALLRVLAPDAAMLTAFGALLFMASDGVLAWRRFVGPFAIGQGLTLSTYYAALWCFARGA